MQCRQNFRYIPRAQKHPITNSIFNPNVFNTSIVLKNLKHPINHKRSFLPSSSETSQESTSPSPKTSQEISSPQTSQDTSRFTSQSNIDTINRQNSNLNLLNTSIVIKNQKHPINHKRSFLPSSSETSQESTSPSPKNSQEISSPQTSQDTINQQEILIKKKWDIDYVNFLVNPNEFDNLSTLMGTEVSLSDRRIKSAAPGDDWMTLTLGSFFLLHHCIH
jgi:hypothetical protein